MVAPEAAANARPIPSQTNAIATGGSRSHGPLVNQQAVNQQQNAAAASAQAQAPVAAVAVPAPPPPVIAAAPVPVPSAPTPRPAEAPAVADAGAADARERRANEAPASEIAEVVSTTSARARRREAAKPSASAAGGAAPGADRDGQARSKDEPAPAFALGAAAAPAMPTFAEPDGRLRWRIADGRRTRIVERWRHDLERALHRLAAVACAPVPRRRSTARGRWASAAWCCGWPCPADGRWCRRPRGDPHRGVGDGRAVGARDRRRWPRVRDRRRRRDVDARDAGSGSPVSA